MHLKMWSLRFWYLNKDIERYGGGCTCIICTCHRVEVGEAFWNGNVIGANKELLHAKIG